MIVTDGIKRAWLVMLGQGGWWTVDLLVLELNRQKAPASDLALGKLLKLASENKLHWRLVGGCYEFSVAGSCLPIRGLTLAELGLSTR